MVNIPVARNILEVNDRIAEQNREIFDRYGLLVINLMSSPGAGKTSLLEKTIEKLKERIRIGVIEGDIQCSFDAERIAKAAKTSGITDKISHKKLVLPGFVATLSGELEEELPGWEIRVGPREAIDIPAYLKVWK